MSRTVDRLKKIIMNNENLNKMTEETKSDYGFNSNIYIMCNNSIPTAEQYNLLYDRYKTIFQTIQNPEKTLHEIIRSNNLASKELRNILGDGFEWVFITNDLYDNISNK